MRWMPFMILPSGMHSSSRSLRMELLSWCCLRAREEPGAYDGTAKKSDGVSNSLICHLDFASWTCSHLSCITVTLFSVSNRILCRPELSTNSLIYSVFCLDCLLMYLYMLCNICFLSTDSNWSSFLFSIYHTQVSLIVCLKSWLLLVCDVVTSYKCLLVVCRRRWFVHQVVMNWKIVFNLLSSYSPIHSYVRREFCHWFVMCKHSCM